MAKQYIGIYGNVRIPIGNCPDCGRSAFIIDRQFACCGLKVEPTPTTYKRESIPEYRRQILSKKDKLQKLEEQDYKCFYCERTLGSLIEYRGKTVALRTHYDHQVPFALTQNNNPTNFVAACNFCNQFKHSFCFATVDEAKLFILTRWQELLDKGRLKSL